MSHQEREGVCAAARFDWLYFIRVQSSITNINKIEFINRDWCWYFFRVVCCCRSNIFSIPHYLLNIVFLLFTWQKQDMKYEKFDLYDDFSSLLMNLTLFRHLSAKERAQLLEKYQNNCHSMALSHENAISHENSIYDLANCFSKPMSILRECSQTSLSWFPFLVSSINWVRRKQSNTFIYALFMLISFLYTGSNFFSRWDVCAQESEFVWQEW